MSENDECSPAGRTCPVCSSVNWTSLSIQIDLAYTCCRSCGHCEKIPQSGSARGDFEASQTEYYDNASIDAFVELQYVEREKNTLRSSLAVAYVQPSSSVLEIGPGGGSFLKWLQAAGHRVTASEHSPAITNTLRRHGFDVIQGEFERVEINKQFDAVFSFHIIEHVVDSLKHLQRSYEIVRPGGILILATPNAHSIQQRLIPKLSVNFDAAHLRVFSPKSLKLLSRSAGWTVVKAISYESPTGWLRLFARILRILRGEDTSHTAGKYSKATTNNKIAEIAIRIFAIISLPLRYAQSKTLTGSEFIVVLKKI